MGKFERAAAIPTLQRGEGGPARFLTSPLAEAFVRGAEVDWEAAFAGAEPRRVRLPTYAFQRERHWIDSASAGASEAPETRVEPAPVDEHKPAAEPAAD